MKKMIVAALAALSLGGCANWCGECAMAALGNYSAGGGFNVPGPALYQPAPIAQPVTCRPIGRTINCW